MNWYNFYGYDYPARYDIDGKSLDKGLGMVDGFGDDFGDDFNDDWTPKWWMDATLFFT
jgi:hypothetical protein